MVRNKSHTPDRIDWDKLMSAIVSLEAQKRVTELMLLAAGAYLGMRVQNLREITWENLLSENFTILEYKTKKQRKFTVNKTLREIALRNKGENTGSVFKNKWGDIMTPQYLNRMLKSIAKEQKWKGNISTHSLRKSFGRRIYENSGSTESSLILLSKIFSHRDISITRRYLGITEQEVSEAYVTL